MIYACQMQKKYENMSRLVSNVTTLPTTSSVYHRTYSYQVFESFCRQTHRRRQKQYLLAAGAQVKR